MTTEFYFLFFFSKSDWLGLADDSRRKRAFSQKDFNKMRRISASNCRPLIPTATRGPMKAYFTTDRVDNVKFIAQLSGYEAGGVFKHKRQKAGRILSREPIHPKLGM